MPILMKGWKVSASSQAIFQFASTPPPSLPLEDCSKMQIPCFIVLSIRFRCLSLAQEPLGAFPFPTSPSHFHWYLSPQQLQTKLHLLSLISAGASARKATPSFMWLLLTCSLRISSASPVLGAFPALGIQLGSPPLGFRSPQCSSPLRHLSHCVVIAQLLCPPSLDKKPPAGRNPLFSLSTSSVSTTVVGTHRWPHKCWRLEKVSL